MPKIQIDDKGTEFFYLDSGVPTLTDSQTPYTTVVLLHGFAFNSYTLRHILPIAAASHMRLILLNRRGYSGTTPLAVSETKPELALGSESLTASERIDFYRKFLEVRGHEIAKFLVKLIETEDIPPKIDSSINGRASGGIALGGWSLGNLFPVSFLAFANTLDPVIVGKLNPYLRKLILYDCSFHALGYPLPEDVYNPLLDPEIPGEQREPQFGIWVSSYWPHRLKHLDAKVPPPSEFIHFLEQRKPNQSKTATMTRFTPDDLSEGWERMTDGHGEYFTLVKEHRPINREVLLKALFGINSEKSAAIPFPNVQVSCVWCTEAHWEAVFTVSWLQADVDCPPENRSFQRSVKFIPIQGGNHFAHYEDPLKTVAALASASE